MRTIKLILKAVLLISLAIQSMIFSIVPANADVMTGTKTSCFPEVGKPETYGSLTIDHSHACLVVFADADIDGWLETGEPQESKSARKHSLSDGFAFLGWRTCPNL
jgi:hypothetical protein